MLSKLLSLLIVSFMCTSIACAGNDFEGENKAEPDKLITKSKSLEFCRQIWSTGGANDQSWFDMGPNGGGGRNYQCKTPGSSCSLWSWRTDHPVGWTPADDGRSTQEWVTHGIQLIKDGALEEGVVLSDADLEGVEYEELWIPD